MVKELQRELEIYVRAENSGRNQAKVLVPAHDTLCNYNTHFYKVSPKLNKGEKIKIRETNHGYVTHFGTSYTQCPTVMPKKWLQRGIVASSRRILAFFYQITAISKSQS